MQRVYYNMDLEKQFICHRCKRYTNGVLCIGRWQCRYHPGEEEFVTINDKDICRFSCCHQRVRDLKYNDLAVIMGQQEHCVRRPKGCTPCDCGDDFAPVHVDELTEFIRDIDHTKWKGFDTKTMILHRTEHSLRSARGGTQRA